MIRAVAGFFFPVILAHWLYCEAALTFPRVMPTVNYIVKTVQIPTHDQWAKTGKKIERLASLPRKYID